VPSSLQSPAHGVGGTVRVGARVMVATGVTVGVLVGVAVLVGVGVGVSVGVAVEVGLGVGVWRTQRSPLSHVAPKTAIQPPQEPLSGTAQLVGH
jgi:hypothetical protein